MASNRKDLSIFEEVDPKSVEDEMLMAEIDFISALKVENTIQSLGKENNADSSYLEDSSEPRNTSSNEDSARRSAYAFMVVQYYQQYFNVDSSVVLDRVIASVLPKRAPSSYVKMHISSNPDLYGPFWIVVTLIFSIAISGNVANYMQHAQVQFHWRYNFHLVSYAATAIMVYVCIVPLIVWLLVKWTLRSDRNNLGDDSLISVPSLLTLVCLYGYSLAIYIPVSMLWVIQISLLQWLLVVTAALLSGSVLVFALAPYLRNSATSLLILSGILSAHFFLAVGFMLYFFHVPNDASSG